MPDEYISREKTLALLKSLGSRDYRREKGTIQDAIKMISSAEYTPAADVAEVVHGEWQGEGDGYADGALVYDVWHCSECGYCIDDGTDDPERLPKYCPSCGAKMDGGIDNATD